MADPRGRRWGAMPPTLLAHSEKILRQNKNEKGTFFKMKWTKSEDFPKIDIGWLLRGATFVELCFMLKIKPKSLARASQSRDFKSFQEIFAISYGR